MSMLSQEKKESVTTASKPKTADVSKIIDNYERLLRTDPLLVKFLQETPDLKVVSLGCGDLPIELIALQRIIKKPFTFYGLDDDKEAIDKCKKQYKLDQNCIFEAVDCSNPIAVKNTLKASKAHLVIFRHPILNVEFENIYASFCRMYTKTVPVILIPGGFIVTSNYLRTEIPSTEFLLKAITNSEVTENLSEGIYALTETSYTKKLGMPVQQRVELYAETNFSVAKYEPVLLLSLESEEKKLEVSPITRGIIEKLTEMLDYNREKQKMSIPQCWSAIGGFLQIFIDNLAKDPEEVLKSLHSTTTPNLFLDNIEKQALTEGHKQKYMENIGRLFNVYTKAGTIFDSFLGLHGQYIPTDTHSPEQLAILTTAFANILKVAESRDFEKMDETARKKHLLQTVELTAARPLLPEEISVLSQQQKERDKHQGQVI